MDLCKTEILYFRKPQPCAEGDLKHSFNAKLLSLVGTLVQLVFTGFNTNDLEASLESHHLSMTPFNYSVSTTPLQQNFITPQHHAGVPLN